MTGSAGVNTCVPWTAALIDEFRQSMATCFEAALTMGITINIRAHLVRADSHQRSSQGGENQGGRFWPGLATCGSAG
jgi:hypothetical protein